MAATRALSAAWPLSSRLTEAGRLEVGGCDAVALAEEFGTPAYLLDEDDLRARARAVREALDARAGDGEVLFASKALPVTAVYRLMAEEGLSVDVASGGELHMALAAAVEPGRIYLHGNAKDDRELQAAVEAGVGCIVVDNADDLRRLEALAADPPVRVLLRVNPDVAGDTHAFMSTGQAASKFGVPLEDAPGLIERLDASAAVALDGLHVHIGSQLLDLAPFTRAAAALAPLGDFGTYDLGGGLGVAYLDGDEPPSLEEWVDAVVGAVHEHLGVGKRILLEPGRALTANAGVTLYRVVTVKPGPPPWVAVDGGMSDNLRPMLYGARYQAEVADRFGGGTPCRLVGKHCESGDVLIQDAELADPRPGDVVAVPVTGAYGHALANNYNGVPRPPVVLCRDGDARVVVRRETYDDLLVRDAD
jgi:diaminopimelate decarboxylase